MKTLNSDIEKLVDELYAEVGRTTKPENYPYWKAWYPLDADAVDSATLALVMLDELAVTEAYPWQTPEVSATSDGGVSFVWHHGARMLVIHNAPTITDFYTADPNGIIHPPEILGMLQLTRIWAWFWDDQSTWVYHRPFS